MKDYLGLYVSLGVAMLIVGLQETYSVGVASIIGGGLIVLISGVVWIVREVSHARNTSRAVDAESAADERPKDRAV